ncbi:hypothetical protein [Sphingomonas sp.]|uniref:hypothetical protein n=1 Tax=Sphingomonas sp. TaxID=28214 RepID=UPI0035BC2E9D
MMIRHLSAAALGLSLAACGSGNDPQPTTNVGAADDYVVRVRALSEGQRDAVLLRAIRDSGRDCQQVSRSTAIPDVGGAPAWAAQCAGGDMWAVAFNPGGIATVTKATPDTTDAKGG